MRKLKVNDEVVVLSGKDKGKKGKIVQLFPKRNRVIVEGVNQIKKTVKPTQESPNGGIVDKDGSLHISKVALFSAKAKKASKIRIEKKDGKNVRVAKACGTVLA